MRRVPRILLRAATAASLVLFATTVVFGALSQFLGMRVRFNVPALGTRYYGLASHDGFLIFDEAGGAQRHVPYLFLAARFAALPVGRKIRRWAATRLRPSPEPMCVVCGYDLRATPERCPECGRAVRPGTAKVADTEPA